MLFTSPSVLQKYDVLQQVLEVLSCLMVKHVSIVSRHGPLEAAFTNKELCEMMQLPEASIVPIDPPLLQRGQLQPANNIVPLSSLKKVLKITSGACPKPGLLIFIVPTGLTLCLFRLTWLSSHSHTPVLTPPLVAWSQQEIFLHSQCPSLSPPSVSMQIQHLYPLHSK
ncbi:hypothetical protein PAXRUDRAFT_352150 [Paxillus rubicundulus Ve08.2h10]|uniref:Uncharacterized protein n=1 Tax=Paxillus rubicundulus Ve08.2h10 TaxID=930991 RepID=A0A0D0DZC0_9AGAM|nr:hypothetical protein PAXRUDRAFT_352150 [Paxillus rubicundulus Ve08.2h10]